MTLHLLKLCVGAKSIADLEVRRAEGRRKSADRQVHVTRMVPRRIDELLDGGSLYWVIEGRIAARQALRAIEPFVDLQGIGRCRLVLDPVLVPDRPADLGTESQEMPHELRLTLAALGLV